MHKAYNIKWETDGQKVSLPKSVVIPNEVMAEDDEVAVANYLSDQYGFLVISLDVK